jgi:c-di-AMP phosphodiesterase-like protein
MSGTVEALGSDDITKVGVIITIALVVIGLILSFVVTALIGRVIILVVLALLIAFVWQQRGHVQDEINAHKCNLHATFFGFHLDAPQSVVNHCHNATR